MKHNSELTRFHNCFILRDSKIIKEDLWVRDGKIANPEEVFYVEQNQADVTVNCDGQLIAPGYIDIQINGGVGIDFSFDSENVEDGVEKVARELLKYGVTSFCPTMVTSDKEKYSKILPRIKKKQGGKHGATTLGVHLEGPFINTAKKGAHMSELIRNPEKGLQSITDMYGSLENAIIVTLAPELPGALEAIKGLAALGLRVAVGHSIASLSEGEAAVNAGVNLITHLFNAMLPFHHRDPGLVGLLAATLPKQIYYGIISDGLHTHPASLRIACKTNPEGLILVSDAIAALGLPDGDYRIGPQAMIVKNNQAYVAGTNTLCGSMAALDECVRVLKKSTECSLEYALEAATLHPARALGIEHKKGTLNYGSDADFVMLHPESLQVHSTWIAGECVYRKDGV
ncbi:hypothetical protein JYU34_009678 [Plutella xylostella]|uniref:N-acetylglucosamine-6-phosphate deacetylase n=1 Tax=Plutella xylostella TaxID=51655 RepID=A0ABQ7QK33_PLUXY|nr:hypothetical protein JYU34_009678 [Plutella xylostella]